MADNQETQETVIEDLVPKITQYETDQTNIQTQIALTRIALQENIYIDRGNNIQCKFLEKSKS